MCSKSFTAKEATCLLGDEGDSDKDEEVGKKAGDVGGEAAPFNGPLVECPVGERDVEEGAPCSAVGVAWVESLIGNTKVVNSEPINFNTSSIISESMTRRSMMPVLLVISKKMTEASVAICINTCAMWAGMADEDDDSDGTVLEDFFLPLPLPFFLFFWFLLRWPSLLEKSTCNKRMDIL